MLSLSEMLEGLESRSHPGPERRIKTLTQTYELPSGAVLTVVDYRHVTTPTKTHVRIVVNKVLPRGRRPS